MTASLVGTRLAEKKTYYLSPNPTVAFCTVLWVMLVWGGGLGLFFGMILRFGAATELIFAEILIVGIGIYGLLVIKRIFQSRVLRFSAEGIEFEEKLSNLKMSTPWDNIAYIQIVLDKPVPTHLLTLRQSVPLRDSKGEIIPGIYCESVPIQMSPMARFRLLADIRHFAPRLFEA